MSTQSFEFVMTIAYLELMETEAYVLRYLVQRCHRHSGHNVMEV